MYGYSVSCGYLADDSSYFSYETGYGRESDSLSFESSDDTSDSQQEPGLNPYIWTQRFAEYMEMDPCDAKYQGLSELGRDFGYASRMYAQVIISEIALTVKQKTYKPVDVGGLAGGQKYIIQGILFKLANEDDMYNKVKHSMKVASHELKGLMSYYCSTEDLKFPLMSVIDYRGWRVVAISLLPISNETLVYGSSDAGATIHKKDEQMNNIMRKSGQVMNIIPHICGNDAVEVYSACDIEGHKTEYGYYLIDYARVMPSQMMVRPSKHPIHLFELLRPELVIENDTPLNPDALVGFSVSDPDKKHHVAEIKRASEKLYKECTVRAAEVLMQETKYNPVKELHKCGINLRHMGFVRQLCTGNEYSSRVLLEEMVSRMLKDNLKEELRLCAKNHKTPMEAPYVNQCVMFFNRVFYSDVFWKETVKIKLEKKYEKSLFLHELDKKYDLRNSFHIHSVVEKLKDLIGLHTNDNISNLLESNEYILEADINSLNGRIKNMSFVDEARGSVL
eukprot:TRINITY_DN662_c1_g2_i2.p2 TRINITY_DN662_c1_g2~~TRINITY_DN662_c1_g2_i2.p2  ORF type:complete len:506 (-),score=103.86 TRINITY_DN662_c1_g2_i2:2144-3661(-)